MYTVKIKRIFLVKLCKFYNLLCLLGTYRLKIISASNHRGLGIDNKRLILDWKLLSVTVTIRVSRPQQESDGRLQK